MRKLLFVLVSVLLLLQISAMPSSSATISAGAAAWYAWWDPIFENLYNGEVARSTGYFSDVEMRYSMDPNFLYGPILSFSFGNWTLSAVLLTGKYHLESEGMISGKPWDGTQDIRRNDLDATINYRVLSFMKIFVGLKGQHYTWNENYQYLGGISEERESAFASAGTGLGLAFNAQLFESTYILFNISGLYLRNRINMDKTVYSAAHEILLELNSEGESNSLGGNATLVVAYYFSAISTTVSLGFRYQYVYLFNTGDREIDLCTNNNRDQFYGIFASAQYTFEI